ncbi:MAG: hypothetical protein R3D78_10425 [Paracoccaceae bacterium]|jgi:hypothetical protein
MGRIFKAIFFLLLLGVIGVVGYAYLGNMEPNTAEQRLQVELPGVGSGG